MPILLTGENGNKNFSKYVKIQFNSSVIQMLQIGQKSGYQSLKKIFKDIFSFCDKDEKYKNFS